MAAMTSPLEQRESTTDETSAGVPGASGPSPAPGPRMISSATVEGNDAVCFTAGPEAAVVGAGTIHAYLSTRRKCPKVVAGISLGALNAAAMQRVYREMGRSDGQSQQEQDAARWTWFRHYVEALSDQPVNVVWNAIPDQSDFFADMMPIRDTSVPRHLQDEETAARRRQYLLVKLGRWLAKLPVSIGLATGVVVNYVRIRENYALGQKASAGGALAAQLVNLVTRLIFYLCKSPQFFPEHKFRVPPTDPAGNPLRYRCRIPLVGWINLFSLVLLLALVPIGLLGLYLQLPNLPIEWPFTWSDAVVPAVVAVVLIVLTAVTAPARRRMMQWRLVQKTAFPPLATVAYLFSLANLFFFSTAVIVLGVWLYEDAVGGLERWPIKAGALLAVDLMINLLFAPLVLLPETRQWLVERRFLRELPRPLFGWPLLAFLWPHLIALITYLALGLYCVAQVVMRSPAPWQGAERFLLGSLWLLLIPVVPVIPVLVPILLYRYLRPFSKGTSGWRWAGAWTITLLICFGLLVAGFWLCEFLVQGFLAFCVLAEFDPEETMPTWWRLFHVAALVLALTWLVILTMASLPVLRRWLATWLFAKVGLQDSLIHDLYLRLKLLRLFDLAWAANKHRPVGPQETVGDTPMPVVIVAASLQTLYERGEPKLAYQLWAKAEAPLLHALRASLAAVPIFAPQRIKGEQLQWWLKDSVRADTGNKDQLERGIDLVDGSVIRQNPLPALYSFLRGLERAKEMAANNDREHPAIHVVYGVPIEGRPAAAGADRRGFQNTIVDVGLASWRLSQRRDTQLEVLQSNVISRFESVVQASQGAADRTTHAIYADEIAPEGNLVFQNALDPQRREILAGIAAGCRRSLETLYRHDLASPNLACATTNGSVACKEFFVSSGRIAGTTVGDGPGLAEVCGGCTGRLRVPAPTVQTSASPEESTALIERHLSEQAALCREHPQLTGERSRIVFVASGGVFRGAFHIGMLGALHACGIKPDLVVGASVGTLMGGALAAMFVRQEDVLARLVDAFLRVDETVALTRTLKSAARELGIRGRAVRLSPSNVRRMLRRGARSDPGFAVTGAPTALIDAMADLLMIPQRQTGRIAADFVAGQVASAANRLIKQLRTETIRRLDIERAAIGTSLLEDLVSSVLTDGTPAFRLQRQPFQQNGIAFYGTTTNLSTQSALLLGGRGLHANAPYDFVEATLASSAFPAVFAPRPESAVFPGTGLVDTFFADGGMFDNLPFLPAIEILSRAQRGYRGTTGAQRPPLHFLQQRLAQPDLLIAGALDPAPEYADDAHGPFDSLAAIHARATSLQHNIKIRAFELASERVYSQLLRLETAWPPSLSRSEINLIDGAVNAAVLPVFPASAEHLNGTFAFCNATGLSRRRVQKSIADGCFQTLLALAREQETGRTAAVQGLDLAGDPGLLTAKSIHGLVGDRRIPEITQDLDLFVAKDSCPFFTRGGKRFACAFVRPAAEDSDKSMRGVLAACRDDGMHHEPRPIDQSPRRAAARLLGSV